MKTYEYLENEVKVTFYPSTPATRWRLGTLAYYEYYARKSMEFYDKTTYEDMYEWAKKMSRCVLRTIETHYNKVHYNKVNWCVKIQPESQNVINAVRQKGYIENVKLIIEFKATTDVFYLGEKYDHLIKAYFYFEHIS